MKRSTRALLIAGFPVSIALGAIVAYPIVKAKVRRDIEARCSAALSATCTVDDLSLRSDGALAEGVHVRAQASLVSSDVTSIAARFSWMKVLTGTTQDLVVVISHPELRDEIPLGDFSLQLSHMNEAKTPEGTPGHLRLTELLVERGDVDVQITLLAHVHVADVEVDWKDGGALEIRWSDASFESLLKSDGTGRCTIKKPSRSTKASIVCPKVKAEIDVDKVKGLGDLVKIFLKKKLPN